MSLQDLLAVVPSGSEEETVLKAIDFSRLPRHVAIIMDGNGRWAKLRRKRRVEGHRAGIAAVRDAVETAARLGLEVLTLYAFSVENWKRPKTEVATLMGLLKRYLRMELSTLLKNNIRFRVIGRSEELPADVQQELQRGIDRTRTNTGLQFNIALNYGGRAEITDAVKRLVGDVLRNGHGERGIDEATLSSYLYTAGQPDPDLLIRTSGELRISNFLLWQIAYAEIWVTDVLWPDFRRRHLLQSIVDYQKRERRYGGIKPA
jgi:undecaprenyl diphosphate synthase